MDNTEKEKVSKVFNTVWDMTKRYCFIPLDNYLWEKFVDEMDEREKEFRQVDEPIDRLYRDIIGAVQRYKQTKEQEEKNGSQSMGAMAD